MTTDTTPIRPTDEELRSLVTHYLQAWNEPDPAARRRLIDERWSPACRYANSLVAYDGHDGVADAMDAAYRRWGATGHRFVAREALDCHHGAARFTWVMLDADGLPAGLGTHLWLLDDEHRIVHDVQFPGR